MSVMRWQLFVFGPALTVAAACAVKQPPAAADALKGVMPPATTIPAEWTAPGGTVGSFAYELLQYLV
jgi:hypothetical protein